MDKIKAVFTSRATWAFLGVLVGQVSPSLSPYVVALGSVFGVQ